MRYVSKQIDVEAMQWPVSAGMERARERWAERIVAWVKANGGEARYEDTHYGSHGHHESRIGVRTINGWAYAAPGHYVVKGEATFLVNDPDNVGGPGIIRQVRDFYPCDPETFERRWEPIS